MSVRRWAQFSLLLLVLFNFVPPLFLLKLSVNNAPEQYLPASQPSVQFSHELRENFPEDQVMVVLFEGKQLTSDAFIKALEEVVKTVKAHPLIDRVISVTSVDHIAGTADGFEVLPLMDSQRLLSVPVEQRMTYMLADSFARGALVAESKDALAMIVRPIKLKDTRQRIEMMDVVQQTVSHYPVLMSAKQSVAGPIPLEVYQLRSMVRDTMLFVPTTMGIGLLLIYLLFRRWLAVVISALVMGAVVNFTLLLFLIFQYPYTLIASMVPSLLSALIIAVLMHFFNGLRIAAGYGNSGQQRVRQALHEIRKPALFTVITTAAGLSSLGLSPIPPITFFGIFAAIGLVWGFIIVIFMLPPIFIEYDTHAWPSQHGLMRFLRQLVMAFARLSIRRAGWVIATFIIIMALGFPFLWDVKVETNLLKFFAEDHPITVATERVENKLSGVTPLEVVFDGAKRDAIKKVEFLQQLASVQKIIEALPEVDKVQSVVDFIQQMHWGFNEEKPEFLVIPDSQALINQYLLLYDGNDLYEIVNREFDRTRVLLNLNVHSSGNIRRVVNKVEEIMRQHMSDDYQWTISGYGKLFEDQEVLLIDGQFYSLIGALLLIMLMMAILWKTWYATGLTLLLNASPALIMFIVMGMTQLWLDMATAMIASVVVGIAVDDTIHLYYGYQRRRQAGIGKVLAIYRSYQYSGSAVFVTTIILSFQFLVLTFSYFQPTIHFGFLTAVGLITALFFDLLLMPALLIMTEYTKHWH
ncbi:efflux RND transporter permease subunit [Zooshikella harenae]|uniref:MMPL family transporter n=1 Tax=Zooshikella harenae TaxID=2827238 RepID=A0ABS5ZAH6_9GAMM|nr:MMPL family transporter [Zooshikella harenae]MBU2709902.1 MMPL family transporter [Zooshikella harenae]